MKAVFDREALASAFQLTGSVVPTRTPKVILQNVKLSVTKKQAVLKATDLESVGITMEVRGVQVEEPGDILLPTGRVNSILRECTDEEIKIEGNEDGTTIRGQFSEFDLPGENPDQYPTVTGFDTDKYHSIASGKLKEMIHRTIFAAASESARYALTGVLWELNEEKVRLVATDGKRMAVVDGHGEAHNGHATGSTTPVVPTKVMQLVEKNLSVSEDPVYVRISTNDALFKIGGAEIYGRLVEGRYPSYREVFPKKTVVKIPLMVGPLTSVIRQAAILTDEDTRGVDFHFAKGTLTLNAKVAEKGRAKIELPVAYDAKPMTTTFDPKLVLDMLRVLEPDTEINLELVENNSVALFTAPGNYSYIVVPLTRGEGR
ncbi:MAG TPA: DNA polymerase III subunit beta [Gemmatales bacterium]|nr:DNA polymerase III subunit beta [Gemmatales bacterium]